MQNRSINRRILAVLLFFFCPLLVAQRFSFQRYGEPQGLLDLVVTDLLQDHEGYIWVATFNGVYRYDGSSFQRFGESDGMPVSTSLFLLETPDGTLWVVSDRAIFRREGNRFHKFELGVTLLGPQPAAWLKNPDRFELATASGLASVDVQSGGLGAVEFDARAKGQAVSSVYSAPDGSLWYNVGGKVCRRDGSQTNCYGPGEGVPQDRWTGIRMDRNRDLWIRSEKDIRRLSASSARFEPGEKGLPPSDGTGLLNLDREGNLFVPTQQGLARLVRGNWQLIGMRQGMTSDSTQVALEDREGSLWTGHLGAGLERWRGYDTWEGWTELEGLANSSILAIEPVSADHLFLGTDRGLVEFQVGRGVVRQWLERDGLAGDHVFALALDAAGDLWIGSAPGGLSRLNRKTGRIERVLAGNSGGIASLAVDQEGSIWAGTDRGVLRFERNKNGRFQLDNPSGTPTDYTPEVVLDRGGRLWAVSSGNLYVFQAQHWTQLAPIHGLQPGGIFNVTEDRDGTKFVLTSTGRIFRLSAQGNNWTATALPALSASGPLVPYFLRSDGRGALWVGTDRGVFNLVNNGAEWRWYTEDDGLVWNDANIGAFHPGSGNDVWIGTSRGLAHYTPTKSGALPPPPRAAIVSLAVNGHILAGQGPFSYGYPVPSVKFHVTALTFTNEERNRFLYRLRGTDAGWQHTNSHEIVYSDLPPGQYTFDVLAQSPDGRVSSEPATAILTVNPPWYLTRSFLITAAAVGLLILIVTFRWRTRSFVLRQRELEAAVAERTAELQVERRFERDQAQIMEMIVSTTGLDEILESIARMVRTYPPGVDCSISINQPSIATLKAGMRRDAILSTAGHAIGWINFARARGSSVSEPISKSVSVAKRLAAVAIESRGAYEKLDYQANHDLLTGLSNRLHFQEGIQRIIQDAAREHEGFALIYIDLNRFKQINDQYGHRIGDLYLQELSNRFRSCMRKGDLLARLGGDEFAVILPGANSAAAARRIVQILEASLMPPVVLPGCKFNASASFGFSIYPDDATDGESLLRAADQAMYRAKQESRNIPHMSAE